MKKLLIFSLLGLIVGFAGFFVYNNISMKPAVVREATPSAAGGQTKTPVSPVFANLSTWAPAAAWGSPQPTTEQTPYGSLAGMGAQAKISGSNNVGNDNLRDQPFMKTLGFAEDINFAADGPGASNWGYSKTENGQTQVVIFGYSTQHLLGPETTATPFVSLSVFVSDPFTKK